MSTADRLSEIRATLRDTRIPTRTSKQTARDRARPLNQAAQRPFIPAPGQKFVRQRTIERKAKREEKKQKGVKQAPKTKQYANPNDIPIKSNSISIKRSGTVEAKPIKQAPAYEPPSKRRKLDNNQSADQSTQQSKKPIPQSSNTHFYEMIAKDSPLDGLDGARADELEMAYLEEKLGLKKSSARSKLMNEIKDDGLDDIFSLVNGIERGMTDEERQRWADEEGIDEDFPVDEPLSLVQPGDDADGDDSDASDQLMPEPDADEFASYYPDEDDEEDGDEQDDGSDAEGGRDNDEEGSQDDEDNEEGSDDDELQSRVKPSYDEIYGFNAPDTQSLLDFKEGSQSTKSSAYVPPHLRGVKSSSSSALDTSITGALNRLTAANIEPLANQLLGYYKSHPPAIVDGAVISAAFSSLTNELNIAGVTRSFIQSLAALLELMHITRSDSNMGFELIERLTQEIDQRMTELTNDVALDATALPVVGTTHLLLLACDLHTFSMIHAPLVLDLMRAATVGDTLTAAQTEILVSAMKSVGSSLRRSEPLALKQLMTSISGHSSIDSAVSGRHTYLLALLDDIKHNKQRYVKPDEQVTHTKNWLQNLVKRQHKKDLDDSMIRLTLEDIRSISERGKWWRIGAAWKGKEKDTSQSNAQLSAQSNKTTLDADGSIDYRLLARRQGLTSPLHIAIFSTVLSSCDFLECFEKLSVQLTLKPNDWVTVIAILIMLSSREAKPNPFYAHLLIHIAEFVPNARFTLQIKFYDFFTNMGAQSSDAVALKKQCINMAHLLAQLLQNARHGLTLAVLKPIKFTTLDLNAMIFLHTLFDVIFTQMADQVSSIFSRLDSSVALGENTKNREAKRTEIDAVKMGITYFFKKYYQTDEVGQKKVKQAINAMG